jgi:hypothetical protein
VSNVVKEIPRGFVEKRQSSWTAVAEQDLKKVIDHNTLRQRVAPIETPFPMKNEQGVVRAATLYLINPINIALAAIFSGRILCHEEFNKDNLRVDMTWKYQKTGETEPTTIAVLEYKRRGYIIMDQFRDASKADKDITDFELRKSSQSTLIRADSNAEKFTKQTAAYAISHRCKHVGLFDWDNLVLFYYKDLREGSVGEIALATMVMEHQNRDYKAESLLSFLIDTCTAAGVEKRIP